MSTLQVSNVHFESTGTNRIGYHNDDKIRIISANGIVLQGDVEYSKTVSFSSNVVINVADNTNAALRITQTGTADAIRIEDSANPDSTPFVVDFSGNVLISRTDSTVGQNVKLDVAGAVNASAFLINGIAFSANVQTFNANGTWTKPTGPYNLYRIQMWGAGGSGGKGTGAGAGCGGGGGGYFEITGSISDLGSTETVTVGLGGASQTVSATPGNNGGNTSFTLTNISKTHTVYGGGGGNNAGNTNEGGGGGGSVLGAGINGASSVSDGVSRAGGIDAGNGGIGGDGVADGGSGAQGTTGGGGGGASSGDNFNDNGAGGKSIYGGAGGGAGAVDGAPGPGAGGISIYGGNGGAGAFDASNATAGTAPGGGGGGSETGNSGAGANGRVIVVCW